MIDVTVREDYRGELLRVEARPLYILDQCPGAATGAAVDHNELAAEIDDKDRGILHMEMFGPPIK